MKEMRVFSISLYNPRNVIVQTGTRVVDNGAAMGGTVWI